MRRARAQYLEEALRASDIAWWVLDPVSGEMFLSDGCYSMLGYDANDVAMSSDAWNALLHPDDKAPTLAGVQKAIESPGADFFMEFRLRTASGGWRWILSRGRLVHRAPDSTPALVGTNVDITQKKLTERAFAESEARWTSLVDEAPVGITLIGGDGTVLFVNRFEAAFHEELVVGHAWKDLLPHELHIEIDWVLKKVFAERQSVVFETYRNLSNGRIVRFENHASPVTENGKPSALLVVSMDISAQHRTWRKQAKAARRMEVLLALHNGRHVDRPRLFQAALDAAFELTDSTTGCLFLFDAGASIYSLQAVSDDFVARPPDTQSLGALGSFDASVRSCLPVTSNAVVEESLLPLGTLPSPVLLKRYLTVPILDQGKVVAIVGVGNKILPYDEDDVDEVRLLLGSLWQLLENANAEAALERLFQAVEHSPVSVVITDPAGVVEYANPRFLDTTGYARDDVLGKPYLLLASGTAGDVTVPDLRDTLFSGQEWKGELTSYRKNGAAVTEWVSLYSVTDTQGGVSHLIAIHQDITERKAAEEMLARSQRMETVGQLAAGVAHDFNNLLTSALAYNEMLLRKLEPGNPLRVFAEGIDRAGRRAADLVSGLLAFGRQQQLSKTRVDLGAILKEEESLLASLTRGRARVEEVNSGPLEVEVDVGQINQVIVNLVSNARDATESESSPIIVAFGSLVDETGKWAWFHVHDDGPGISETLQERIFEPFFTTKPIGKGTGLGLSIVHGIVEQHHGVISVTSGGGRGTTFTVKLPLLDKTVEKTG